jgi:tetratricopeptide (TPR) repeat protein
MSILPSAVVMAILLGATAWAWKTNFAWGFLGAWFFLILAPSSSFIPLDSPAYEHRMYLPLAAVVVPAVMGIHALAGRRTVTVAAVLAVGLGVLTVRRNQDYRSETAIWLDTVAKRPGNPRAHYNLGNILGRAGKNQEAIAQYEQALLINPNLAQAHNNFGMVLRQMGNLDEAIGQYEQALRINPDLAEAHYNLGLTLAQRGRVQDAITQYEETLRLEPRFTQAKENLARLRAAK